MANAQGVNTDEFAQRMYEIVSPAIKEAMKGSNDGKQADPTLGRYTGSYESGFGGEIAIVEWEDSLAVLSLPDSNPMRDLTRLKHVGEHSFRRVRKDESLAEVITFEMGPDGRAARLVWNSNQYRRVR